ncbi:unnamed protein product, partial [Prorocentrum cordatum]
RIAPLPGAAYAVGPDADADADEPPGTAADGLHGALAEGTFGAVVVPAVKVDVAGAGGCGLTPSSSRAQGKWKSGAVWRGEVWRALGGRSDAVELRSLFFDGRVVFLE